VRVWRASHPRISFENWPSGAGRLACHVALCGNRSVSSVPTSCGVTCIRSENHLLRRRDLALPKTLNLLVEGSIPSGLTNARCARLGFAPKPSGTPQLAALVASGHDSFRAHHLARPTRSTICGVTTPVTSDRSRSRINAHTRDRIGLRDTEGANPWASRYEAPR
jgi:hypothetical protein